MNPFFAFLTIYPGFGVTALIALSSVAVFALLKPRAGAEVSGQRAAADILGEVGNGE